MGTYVIKMPDVGEGVAEAEVVEWMVKPGDIVREDDVLAVVMTDKASVEIPSPVEGKVLSLGAEIGVMVAVGSEIVRLEISGEGNLGAEAETAPEPVAAAPPPPPSEAPKAAAESTTVMPFPERPAAPAPRAAAPTVGAPRPAGEKPLAPPAVRKRAHDLGIDLTYVHGSGPAGRITHEDLDSYASGKSAPRAGGGGLVPNTAVDDVKLIGMRRVIAERMQIAKQRIPHISYVEEVDVTEVEALRAQLNALHGDTRPKLTFLPFLMRAMVRALPDFPLMNARFDDDAGIIQRYGGAHIGVATQTPQGLVVPVVRHAEALDLWGCAGEVKRLSDAARDGKAARDELTGSTITITSLGPIGGLVTTPVINYPEVAIIGVNKMRVQPVYQDGAFVPRTMMNLSSSFDHRIIDGWDAASFVQRLKTQLEHPATLFMET